MQFARVYYNSTGVQLQQLQTITTITTVLEYELKIIMQLKKKKIFLSNQDTWVKIYREENFDEWGVTIEPKSAS